MTQKRMPSQTRERKKSLTGHASAPTKQFRRTSERAAKEGIKQFDLKKSAIVILTRIKQPKRLVDWILADTDVSKWANQIDRIKDSFAGSWSSKWSISVPTDEEYVKLFDVLVHKLGLADKNAQWFFSVSFSDFVRALKWEQQTLVAHLMEPEQKPISNAKAASLLRNMKIHPDMSSQAATRGLQSKFVEQKYCYMSPDSALRWYKFISNPNYRQNRECSAALMKFLDERNEASPEIPTWQEFFRKEAINGVAILGGGSPSKDELIFESMLKLKADRPATHLNFSIVDFSPYMALETLLALESAVDHKKHQVRIRPIIADFENLAHTEHDVRRDGGGLAWFMLGGTLGNLNEEKFFQSISGEAHTGDWLVVGVETIDDLVTPEARASIESKYAKNDDLVQFFHTPLVAAWNALHTGSARHAGDIDKALNNRSVKLLAFHDKGSEKYVKIPKSQSIVVTANLNDEDKTILKSTRYHEQSLVDYARHYEFECIKSVASPDNPSYKLLVFERQERRA